MISSLCPQCKGVTSRKSKCSICKGKGMVRPKQVCSNCSGKGFSVFRIKGLYKVTCPSCKGKGIRQKV